MDYRNYSVEDFILDARFTKWVLEPNPETNRYWENWLANHPHRWKDLSEARKLLLNLSMHEHAIKKTQKQELLAQINSKIDQDDQAEEKKIVPISPESVLQYYKHKYQASRNYWWVKIAAILVLALGTVFIIQLNTVEVQPQKALPVMTQKSTEWGVKSHITLKDGTRVLLNAGSKISYLPNFSETERNVYLEGEAYFEVAKDLERPFKVYSGQTVTTALGTTFNISAYPGQPNISIALIEGKVKVGNEQHDNPQQNHNLLLLPGEMATYHLQESKFEKGAFNEKMVTSWVKGILYFKEDSEREVFSKLEKWYGVKIKASQSPKKWNYSAEFQNESLENVLFAMSYTMNFTYEIRSSEVLIYYKN